MPPPAKSPSSPESAARGQGAGAADQARTHARRRLVGALVLLVAGIVVFPLVFETEPRPAGGPAPAPAPVPTDPPAPVATYKPADEPPAAPEPAASAPATAEPTPAPVAPVPAPAPPVAEAPAPPPAPQPKPPAASAPAPAAERYVVQVGAYRDEASLKAARQRVEKLGLKTYTQVVTVEGSKRTRVRVGPFASRAEADRAGARLKGAGLPADVLAL